MNFTEKVIRESKNLRVIKQDLDGDITYILERYTKEFGWEFVTDSFLDILI